MLRSPVEVMYSLYFTNRYGSQEPAETFSQALTLEASRKKDKDIPDKSVILKESFYYQDIVKYSKQIKRYFKYFAKAQIKIIIFNEFTKNPQKIYSDILRFLEVDTNFSPQFKIHNPSKKPLNPILQKFATDLINILFKTRLAFIIPEKFFRLTRDLSKSKKEKPSIDKDLERKLKSKYKNEVKLLSKLTKKDLSMWK